LSPSRESHQQKKLVQQYVACDAWAREQCYTVPMRCGA
jgi:hypothetical protein